MKRRLFTFALAALTIGLLGSCSNINERIDGLDKRVYDLENTKIASVEQQITAINTSINELKAADVTINGKIADLKTAADAQQALIDALQEADRALGQKDAALEARIATLEGQVTTINGQIDDLVNADIAINTRIDTLSTYVDTQIGKAKDWATATFASLTEYEKTAEDLAKLSVTVEGISTTLADVQTSIAGLDTKIDGIDAALQGKITAAKTELEGKITSLKAEFEDKIADAIAASETSLQGWVNKQLEGYYTIAQVDAKVKGLQDQIDNLKKDDETKKKIAELESNLEKLTQDLENAKTTIKAEYEKAIKDAIEVYNGTITKTIQSKIDEVNATIAALTGRVDDLETAVGLLTGRIDAIEAMIQSVSITPAYSNGSVEAVDGILTLKCIVSPAEALIGMESLKDSLLIYADSVKVKTKATTPAYMTIKVSEASVLDADQGAITLTADISEYLPKGEDKALTVAVNIKNGISNFTTEFVPVYVYVAPAPLPDGALKGEFSVGADKKVKFSKGNLYWDGDSYEFEENQYTIGTWNAENHVNYFFWSKEESVAKTESYSDASAAASDVFFTNATAETAKADFTVSGVTGKFRTLSAEEWTYILSTRANAADLLVEDVTVCGVEHCLVIAPDACLNSYVFDKTKKSYDAAAWATAEAAGLICLPPAGYRDGTEVKSGDGNGFYWASTTDAADKASNLGFKKSDN